VSSHLWRIQGAGGHARIDIVTLFISSAPVNVITDIAIVVLPLPMVTAMRLDARQTVGQGLFVSAVDVVRIAYLQDALIYQIDADAVSRSIGLGLDVADLVACQLQPHVVRH
jgi:hypothetical protein